MLGFLLSSLFLVGIATKNGDDPSLIQQLHLAQGKTPSTMNVAWASSETLPASCTYWPSEQDSGLKTTTEGFSTSYNYTQSNSIYHSPSLFTVTLSDLHASTKYSYFCGGVGSEVHSFTTLATVGDASRPLQIAVVGDLGQTGYSARTVREMEKSFRRGRAELILHAGDLSYANCDPNRWDSYAEMTAPLAQFLPWMVCAGNHEIEQSAENPGLFAAFEARYHMPSDKPATIGAKTITGDSCTPSVFQAEYNYGNSFYSFSTGLAHFIVLSSYSVSNSSSEQFAWLKADLAEVNRTITPWIVVTMHCPWMNSNQAHQQEKQTVEMKKTMEGILYEQGANLVFSGHVHAYERSVPAFNGQPEPKRGITYINIGDGGNQEGHSNDWVQPSPAWSAYRDGKSFGHGNLVIENATHARFDWVRDRDAEFVHGDSVTICNSVLMDASC